MQSVFDQLSWDTDTDATSILQLVSAQLSTQEELRQRINDQLSGDYPASALAWISTVTWKPATLVPLTSFDLSDVRDWPTWKDTDKIAFFTEKIKSGWQKPLVSVKVPGTRYLDPIDGHTRLSICWKLKRPVLTWIGKTYSVHGPWELMHRQQRGMTVNQKEAAFTGVHDQLISFSGPVDDDTYQSLLLSRKKAREEFPTGDCRRIAAERAVRQARKTRNLSVEDRVEDTVSDQLELTEHRELLELRRIAQSDFPPGHPERIQAERAVRHSRASSRKRTRSNSETSLVYDGSEVGKS